MGPGSPRSLASGAHSRDPLACPGRRRWNCWRRCFHIVVPANAGTHNHRYPCCAKLEPQLCSQPRSVVMGPGSPRSLSSGAHSRDPLACPGRRRWSIPRCPHIVVPANAGTHNHKCSCCATLEPQLCYHRIRWLWVPGRRGACHRARIRATRWLARDDGRRTSHSSGFNPASICARRGSRNGGKASFSPSFSIGSSLAKPGPSVAISNRMPFGSRK